MKILVTNLIVLHIDVCSECFETPPNSEVIVHFYGKYSGTPFAQGRDGWRRNIADSIIIEENKVFNNQQLTFNVITTEMIYLIKQFNEDSFNIIITIPDYAVITGTCEIVNDDVADSDSLVTRKLAPNKQAPERHIKR